MKQLSNNTFLPETGEVMIFEDVYGKPAGDGMSTWRIFGDREDPKNNPISICIALEPFDSTEREFMVSANSAMTNILGGQRVLIVSTKPYAEPGDEENVAEMEYGPGKMNGNLRFYVNDKPEPPQGVTYTTKWVYNPDTGKREQVQVEVDAGVWLRPHVDYYVTYSRVGGEFGQIANNPLMLYVVGSDHPDQARLDVTYMEGDLEAYEVDLGPAGTGLFIPDNV